MCMWLDPILHVLIGQYQGTGARGCNCDVSKTNLPRTGINGEAFGLIRYQVIGSVLAEYHSHRCQLAVLDFMVSIPYRYENSGFTGQQVTGDLVHPSRFKSKYCKTEIEFVLDLIY
jgi:hypothetical protein